MIKSGILNLHSVRFCFRLHRSQPASYIRPGRDAKLPDDEHCNRIALRLSISNRLLSKHCIAILINSYGKCLPDEPGLYLQWSRPNEEILKDD